MKEPVHIRYKELAKGDKSLYLDITVCGQKRVREFLRLYLVPEKTKEDKDHNKRTMQLANAVKAQRIVDIQNKRFGFNEEKPDILFFPYMDSLAEKRNGSTQRVWKSIIGNIEAFEKNKDLLLRNADDAWIERFVGYLRKKGLNNNTVRGYVTVLGSVFNTAVKNELLERNPMMKVELPKPRQSKRNYLTLEEVQRLAHSIGGTTGRKNSMRRAFLFCCLTGLRYSDMSRLRWADVKTEADGRTRIVFRQKKTSNQEYLDINQQARLLMGEAEQPDDVVFGTMPKMAADAGCFLTKWMGECSIDKHITWHCSRHTFAVMMLDIGTDIYVVSKLLGHTSVKTTQIYAKVLDKNKQKAVDAIPNIF